MRSGQHFFFSLSVSGLLLVNKSKSKFYYLTEVLHVIISVHNSDPFTCYKLLNMQRAAKSFIYSFPVQLLAMHLKRNHFLFLFWVLLFSMFTGMLGENYGVSLLFLDPEYLGNVGFSSFCILGCGFGAFVMVWQVTSYILNARYFPFLATLNRPFGIYCLNNSIFPGSFFILYFFQVFAFQAKNGLLDIGDISFRLLGFICGMITFIMITSIYFFRTNKSIFQIIGGIKKRKGKNVADELTEEPMSEEVHHRPGPEVDYYLNHNIRWRRARSADHYPESIINSVYKQHHANALFIELTAILLIVLLGLLMEKPYFRIPAGSSIFLLFAILIVLIGAFSYWLGKWKLFFFILLIIGIDALMSTNLFSFGGRAYGLDYTIQPSVYSIDTIKKLNSPEIIEYDKRYTIEMLNNWKNKFDTSFKKPKLIVMNCSGGGLRASLFAFEILQRADSITSGALMDHCVLISGASGGMIASSYYRELYYRQQKGEQINLYDDQYAENIASDLLNSVSFAIVVNDLFYPWQEFQYAGNSYKKDRGYMFEKMLNENTGNVLYKPISSYKDAEYQMQIPMIVFSPTIINDERILYISAQPVSYLCVPVNRLGHITGPETDAIDFRNLLQGHQPDSLNMLSAIRMNGTFPYILPNVHLPTQPEIEVMDAGIRDNFGIETSVRYLETFKDWITENTSGVIVMNIRGFEQEMKIREDVSNGVFEKMFNPVGNLYMNWVEVQDYQNEYLLNYLDDILDGNLEVITFEYQPSENKKRTSLSFHLTTREKRDIKAAAVNVQNTENTRKLEELLR